MNRLDSICVFCGSSPGNDPKLLAEAEQLGKTLAIQQIKLVYGGAKIGVMGAVANGVLRNNGSAIGVIPDFLKKKEVVHLGLTELITTRNMHERKLQMHELSDGFVTLPGGFGTLEELFEIITWAQLGLHQKPIGLLNINGFYDHLLAMLQNMVDAQLLKPENMELLIVDSSINKLLEKMYKFEPSNTPKWLNVDQT